MFLNSEMPLPQHWIEQPAPGASCAIIAEVAQAHDGSLGMAHSFIDAAAQAGATAVKFQTHIAAAESTLAEQWRVKFSQQDQSRYDYWKRMEFTPEQWQGLKVHAESAGLVFLSSPFSPAAVELLRKLGVVAWKVASGELTNLPMIEDMARDKKPVMLSTGMSDWSEIEKAVQVVKTAGAPYCIFQCTTQYPSPPESIGLNVLGELRAKFGCAVGLSDHSGTIYPGLAAVARHEAEVLEVHLTLSRAMFGPDVVASVTPDELRQLCEGVRFIEKMRSVPIDKSRIDEKIAPMRQLFFKSVVAAADLAAGTVLKDSDIAIKKPGGGIPAAEFKQVIGRRLVRNVAYDTPLQFEDLVKE